MPAFIGLLLLIQVSRLDLSENFLQKLAREMRPAWLLGGIALVLPNYYFEIIKWKILARLLEQRSFSAATHEVLRGLRLGLVTPFMAGDYLGRSYSFRKENRLPAVLLNLYNSFTQTWTALFFGGAALFLWYFREHYIFLLLPAAVITAATLLGLGLLYGLRFDLLQKWAPFKKYTAALSLPLYIKNRIIGLSLLRSLTYNLQYFCFYLGFGISLDLPVLFIGINLLLLVKTVGGGLNVFGDLTLRELGSLYFFRLYPVDEPTVLMATFVVWFFNVFTPVLIGIFYKPAKNASSDHL